MKAYNSNSHEPMGVKWNKTNQKNKKDDLHIFRR